MFLLLAAAPAVAADFSLFPKWQSMLDRMEGHTLETLSSLHAQLVGGFRHIADKGDYWKTPAEFYRDGGGDCEDFAIALYFKALSYGVPEQEMAIVVGMTDRQEIHAVLRWKGWYFDYRSKKPIRESLYLQIFAPIYEISREGWKDLQ